MRNIFKLEQQTTFFLLNFALSKLHISEVFNIIITVVAFLYFFFFLINNWKHLKNEFDCQIACI